MRSHFHRDGLLAPQQSVAGSRRASLTFVKSPCGILDEQTAVRDGAVATPRERRRANAREETLATPTVDKEDCLVDPSEWIEDWARETELASGVALTDEHWDAITLCVSSTTGIKSRPTPVS